MEKDCTAYDKIVRLKEAKEDELLKIEGVVGIGIGKNKNNEYCIRVYVKKITGKIEMKIPKKIDDTDIEIIEIGEVRGL